MRGGLIVSYQLDAKEAFKWCRALLAAGAETADPDERAFYDLWFSDLLHGELEGRRNLPSKGLR